MASSFSSEQGSIAARNVAAAEGASLHGQQLDSTSWSVTTLLYVLIGRKIKGIAQRVTASVNFFPTIDMEPDQPIVTALAARQVADPEPSSVHFLTWPLEFAPDQSPVKTFGELYAEPKVSYRDLLRSEKSRALAGAQCFVTISIAFGVSIYRVVKPLHFVVALMLCTAAISIMKLEKRVAASIAQKDKIISLLLEKVERLESTLAANRELFATHEDIDSAFTRVDIFSKVTDRLADATKRFDDRIDHLEHSIADQTAKHMGKFEVRVTTVEETINRLTIRRKELVNTLSKFYIPGLQQQQKFQENVAAILNKDAADMESILHQVLCQSLITLRDHEGRLHAIPATNGARPASEIQAFLNQNNSPISQFRPQSPFPQQAYQGHVMPGYTSQTFSQGPRTPTSSTQTGNPSPSLFNPNVSAFRPSQSK